MTSLMSSSAKGGEGDRLEADVQAPLLDDVVRATILVGDGGVLRPTIVVPNLSYHATGSSELLAYEGS